jgi:hypothetical protein
VGSVAAAGGGLFFLRGQSLDKPGVYRFEARSADGKISGRSNPVWVQQDPTKRRNRS